MEHAQAVTLIQYGHSSIPKLLLDFYAKIGLKETEMMLLLHINRFIDDNQPFPTPAELAERMSISEGDCSDLLRELIKNNFLEMKQEQDEHVMYETYSLGPLYEQIVREVFTKSEPQEEANADGRLFDMFEQEFARPLSPMECETITVWLDQDHYHPEMVEMALREAVLSGKVNMRYIDRILHEWKKNGVRSSKDAKSYSEKFRRYQRANRPADEQVPKYPNINWLDES
ncbi:DnaD domain-containing protein [Bacillus piscicola]|uniref:DnaD domain-containing protein n=1 Tax=Bacillus piscicola TaxID=1632684 RepID=UPI001F096546|nr:DnaD domain-containing protein [Bacillus piscicola]